MAIAARAIGPQEIPVVAHRVRCLAYFLVLLFGSLHLACDEKTNNNSWLAALLLLGASPPDTRLLRIYVTTNTYNPLSTIGGISGADSKCNSDAGKPSSGTYKALLAASTARRACSTASCSGGSSENIDWPLKASRSYYRTNQTTEIGTTTAAGIFEFPLKAPFATSGTDAWTGLNTNWTTSAATCSEWTGGAGTSGCAVESSTTATGISDGGGSGCSTARRLICVEQ